MFVKSFARFIKKKLRAIISFVHYVELTLAVKRNFAAKNPKIAILIIHQYHAGYLTSLVSSDSRFVFRNSKYRCYNCDKVIPEFDWSDPNTLDVVLTDDTDFLKEGFTKRHRLILRMQHSPGFGFWVLLYLYEKIKRYHGKLMIPIYIWNFVKKFRHLDKQTEKIRNLILKDKTPLIFTHYDPKMNAVFNHPHTVSRQEGTLLVALNWRIAEKKNDVELLIEAIDLLRKELKVKVLYHPIVSVDCFNDSKPLFYLKEYLHRHNIESQMGISSLNELVNLYDEYDFILTDGSGSVYEAIVRGCKALTLDGLSYQRNQGVLHPAVELGLLPKTLVWNYKKHPGNDQDLNFVKELYGSHSLTREDITPFIGQEIIGAFKNWT